MKNQTNEQATYRLVYSAYNGTGNCGSIINHYGSLDAALDDVYPLDDQLFNKSADYLGLALLIDNGKITKEYTLARQEWDKEKGEWGKEEKFDFDYDSPDQEYES